MVEKQGFVSRDVFYSAMKSQKALQNINVF